MNSHIALYLAILFVIVPIDFLLAAIVAKGFSPRKSALGRSTGLGRSQWSMCPGDRS